MLAAVPNALFIALRSSIDAANVKAVNAVNISQGPVRLRTCIPHGKSWPFFTYRHPPVFHYRDGRALLFNSKGFLAHLRVKP